MISEVAVSTEKKRSRRGPVPLSPEEKRNHTVSVRLNPAELEWLDAGRAINGMQRGEYLRVAALGKLPPVVPQVNREAWVKLARAAANLNQIAHRFNVGDDPHYHDVVDALFEFRCSLIGANGGSDEG